MGVQAPSPSSSRSLVDILHRRALYDPDRRAYLFLDDGTLGDVELTYGELDRRARAVGVLLSAQGLTGERVLLLYPPGVEYITSFFGCLYAGAVAVPAYPPSRHGARLQRTGERLQAIVENCQPRALLTTQELLTAAELLGRYTPYLRGVTWLAPEAASPHQEEQWHAPGIGRDTLAFLQYTSGSTSAPKGVMVTHGNLLDNSEHIRRAFGTTPESVGVSWLPFYHDMGLIGSVVHPLYVGMSAVLLSPLAFLRRPFRWLEAISRFRAQLSMGPSFAYDICVDKIDEGEKAQLDLSAWQVAVTGAEPIRADTLHQFEAAFRVCGFRREAFFPCYGLAEATLCVSSGIKDQGPRVRALQAAALERGKAVEAAAGETHLRRLISCGRPMLGQRILIVDPDTSLACGPGQIGEIWVAGTNVAQGYWQRPEETAQTFGACLADSQEGPFLRTGDLGFIDDGELFVTGRLKDLLIIRGRNYYPQDIEHTVEQSDPALRKNCSAAFAIEVEEREELVLLCEVDAMRSGDHDGLIEKIREAVLSNHDVRPYAVALIKPNSISKTSSGKSQRHACRHAFLEGHLAAVAQWQERQPRRTTLQTEVRSARPRSVAEVEAWLGAAIARHRGLPSAELDVHAPFQRFGLDSVDTVMLTGELETWLGSRLTPTLLWDYPSIARLARHLVAPASERTLDAQGYPGRAPVGEPIAIIGLGCRLPGADSPEAFWQLLASGRDPVCAVPPERGALGHTGVGGYLDRVDGFEPQFFGISPREASQIDPQQRLLLEVTWEALEYAGLAPDRLAERPVGVFVGIATNDYSRLPAAAQDQADVYAGTGNALSIAANRISYLLDLRGPSMAIDTACSSSLVAVHLACMSLWNGESEVALAGGVNLILSPLLSYHLAQAGFLAPDGRCRTFDARANGYVRSEGAGMVVLKPLTAALRDGDHICAVIKGTAVNQDGRTNGLTAPNGVSQAQVIQQAYEVGSSRVDLQACKLEYSIVSPK